MQRILLSLALSACLTGLTACGTKGPLYLPESPPEQLSSIDIQPKY